MGTRIITAIVGIVLIAPFFYFSDTVAFCALFSLISLIAVYEMMKCTGFLKPYSISIPTYIIAAACPFISRYCKDTDMMLKILLSVLFVYLFYLLCVGVFSKGKIIINNVAFLFSVIIYIIIGFSSVVLLRDMQNGQYLYLLIFFSSWATDIFAYFTGRLFGKHKLIPDISPKKTVEGAIGGIIGNIAFLVIYGFILNNKTDLNINLIFLALEAIIISVISQCGDLIASAIKRKYDIKDYGKLLPGHGGIMDRFDSSIAVAPFLYILFSLNTMFNIF